MPFASLKKTSKRNRRHYKERQQPSRRSHLGHLEKHKDYVVRAKDYQRKAASLKSLRQRARDRNPDEFYFHMSRSRLTEGKHTEVAPTASDKPAVPGKAAAAEKQRLQAALQQDANYLRHKLQVERAQLAKLEPGLAFVAGTAAADSGGDGGGSDGPCRTVFDRSEFVRHLRRKRGDGGIDTGDGADLEAPGWSNYLASLDKLGVLQLAKERSRALKAAKQRAAREAAISSALAGLEAKRSLAADTGRRRKLVAEATAEAPPVWKFAFKRQR